MLVPALSINVTQKSRPSVERTVRQVSLRVALISMLAAAKIRLDTKPSTVHNNARVKVFFILLLIILTCLYIAHYAKKIPKEALFLWEYTYLGAN